MRPPPNSPTHVSDLYNVLIGRQAILDREQRLWAYELLYRSDSGNNSAIFEDGDKASAETILNAFLHFGLEKVSEGKRVFINLTRQLLVDQLPIPLDRDKVILEVLETVEIDQPLIEAVKHLRARGFRIALDDFSFEPRWEPLLPLAHVIKVEISPDVWAGLPEKLGRLRENGALLLAEKVESREQFERLHALGFDLFQGYFFARPDVMAAKTLSENQTGLLELLRRVNDPDVDFDDLVTIVKVDPALSYKMLRAINSARFALRREITSIREALTFLGLSRVRALASLYAMSGLKPQGHALLSLALVRAGLCRRLTAIKRIEGTAEAYSIGLLSVLDALLDQPMVEALKPLPTLYQEVILERKGELGQALSCVLDVEASNWTSLACGAFDPRSLQSAYAESLQEATEMMELMQ